MLEDTSKNTNRVFSFLARGICAQIGQRLEGNEAALGISVELHPLQELRDLVRSSAICAQSSVVTILKAFDLCGPMLEPGPRPEGLVP